MFFNFFKFISVVFLLVLFQQNIIAQTVLIDPAGDGGLENGSTFLANGWTTVNHTTNTWQVGTVSVPYAGTNAGFVSNDGGTTNAYTNSVLQTSHFYRDITVPAAETIINLSFQWKGNGESGWDRLLIYTAPTSVTPVVGVPASNSTTLTGATLVFTQTTFPQAAYGLQSITLPSSLAGTTFRLIYTWQNDASIGTNPPVSLDNISLISRMPITPAPPITFTATTVTTTSMDIGWTDNSTDETFFRVYRSSDNVNFFQVGANIPTTSGGTTGTLYSQTQSGLLPGVTYFFRISALADLESAYLTGSQATLAGGSITSNGTGGGLWSATTTWTGGVVPTATDDVTILNGDVVTLDATGLVCNNLTIGGGTSGTLEYQATPLAGLTVNGNLTVAAGGTFSAGTGILATHTLSIGSATGAEAVSGDLVNHGTFDLNTTAGVTTTFLGLANTIISGTGSTPDFWAITVNKGTTRTDATLDVLIPITMSLVTTSTNRLVITNGTFKISSATDITPAGGTQNIIAAGGRLWLNHASAIYNGGTAGSPTIIGELRIDAGTFNYGSGNNTMTFSSTVPGGVLTMNGGTINFLGAVAFSSAVGVQFNMSGGNFNVDPQATNLSATATTFSIGTSTAVNWSGGVVTIIDPRATAGSTSFSNFSNTLNNKFITGGKLRLGDGTSTASGGVLSTTSGFAISASGGVWDLEIDNRTDASDSRVVRVSGTTVVRNNVEIKTNGSLYLASSATGFTLVVEGNMINDGFVSGFVPTGTTALGTLFWRGLGAQSLTGSGTFATIATMSFYNLGTAFSRSDFEYNEENDLWNQQAELSDEVREMRPIYTLKGKRSENLNSNPQLSTVSLLNANPFVVSRVNAFSGNLNTGSNFTIGHAASQPIVQIGSGLPTDPGGTFSTLPTFNNVLAPSTYIYSIALGSHTTGAYNEMPAGPQTWTQVLINDVDGLFLDRPVTVNSTMTMTSGNINTTSTNIMTFVATTTIAALATSYIKGPFARVIPANQVAGLTLNYPVGKDTLKPMFLVDPLTNADGLTVISAEVFEGNSGGTPGTGMLSLNTNRYFNASIVSGDTNLISTKVRLTEAGLTSTMGMGKSETVNGAYNLVSSAVPSGGTITSDNLSSLSFFAIGERDLAVSNPTNVSAAAISSTQINVAFTPSGGNNVVIVWNLTGTFSAPVGAPPAIGEPFAGGTLLSNGITSPVNHTGLTQNTLYYYKAFSYDGTDYSLGVDVNATTPFGLPYSQDFNAGTTLPPGWSVVGFFVSGNHGTTGSNGLTRNFWSSAQTGTARTPFIGPATADAVFEFDYRIVDFSGFPNNATVLGAGNFFNFQVSTDNTTWTTIHTIDNTNHVTSLSFAHKILDLSAYAGSIIYVRVSGQWASGDYYLDIDNVQLRVQPTDPIASLTPASFNFGSIASGNSSAPANFTIQNIGAGTLTINSGGITITGANADQFALGSITYPINLTAGQSQVFTATFSPTSGGQKTASLEVVHNAAGSPSTSSLSGRGLPAGSLVEDFNGTTFPPAGWLAFNNDTGTKTWYRSTLNFNSAPASAGSDWESTTITNNDWLITPRLTVASGDLLTFYHRARSTFFTEVLHIKIGDAPDPNGTWTDLLIINDNTLDWKYKEIDLTAYAGQNKYIAFVNRGMDQFTIYVDDVSGPVLYAAANDLGVIDYAQVTTESIETEVTVSTAGMTRSLHQKDPTLVVKPQEFKISLKPVSVRFEEAATAQFEVTVKNFGTAAQNSYQIGWEIDGIQQTSVSNTDPIAPGAEQIIALSWASASAGAHATRAWTILGGDENAANDTSATIGFFVLRDNSKFFEGFEANLPPVPPPGWLTVNNDGGGTVGPWAAAPTVFAPVEGNTYIAANFSGANGFLIDDWLISPNTGANSSNDDTLSFWVQSPVSQWLDSLEIRVSTTGTDIADFTQVLAYISVPKGQWTEFKYALPSSANRYIAFRYLMYDGGFGTHSDYIGLDAVEIFGGSGSATFQLSVNVADGWNMVSIPGLHPTDQNVSTWWAFRDLGANVFRYAGGYQSVTAAVPGTGYWMKHAGVRTYNTGDEWPAGGINVVPHDPITAALGWNLFGGYELSVTATNVTTVPSGLQSGSIFQYSGGYQVATTLNPGYGYWIKLNAAGQIIIPETMAKGEAVEYFAEDWGRIILTDATGINYTLYAVKGEVNLDNYELPPAPPAGMFDIRYSSGRIAEDINSSVKTIDMSGVTYPLTVRVEGMDVRLMDESGKAINVNLKAGEDIVISDASVMKLMVSGELIPAQYALEQNYPNPFNPSTIIEFSLPENVGNVKLSIYNALGEKVAELVNTALTAGKYQYQWNASNVATGMYIYELRTDKFVSVKKMLLLK